MRGPRTTLLAFALLASGKSQQDVSLPGPVTQGKIDPVTVTASMGKVKTLLTGQPPADAEVAAVTADPRALRALVQKWVATPEHQQKLLGFFSNAFQQS